MDRQNLLIAAIAVVLLALVGVFAFLPGDDGEPNPATGSAPSTAETGGY